LIIINEIPKIDDVTVNGVTLNDRDFHCIARLFQSVFFAPEPNYFYSCAYCKYAYECHVDPKGKKLDISDFNMIRLLRNLGKITGVDNGALLHKRLFYVMSVQELYPEKAQRIYELLPPEMRKKLKKSEDRFTRSFKVSKWYLKFRKKEGVFKYKLIRKILIRLGKIYSNIHNKLAKIKWRLWWYLLR